MDVYCVRCLFLVFAFEVRREDKVCGAEEGRPLFIELDVVVSLIITV